MLKNLKHTIRKMFREFLVYHHSSMEYRAKILTLMVSANGEICECEKQKMKDIAYTIYGEDHERAELLIDTVNEYHEKIVTNNGLDFEHLIQLVEKETKENKRFAKKIDIGLLSTFKECIDEEVEEDVLFHERLLEFLQDLKDVYGEAA
ncbi:MAG TPA: hypothetical protein EYH42_09335 [Sulfurovum sp.]|nr:hypothetical protein [Sulfurovum sp.]